MNNIPERTESSKKELEVFAKEISKIQNDLIVEVGSYTGVSACIFAKYFKQVICVDLWQNDVGGITNIVDMSVVESIYDERIKGISNIKKMKLSSLEGSLKFKDLTIPSIYIDADHEYENVKNDLSYWIPKVIKGGIISGHDYTDKFAGCKKAINEAGKPLKVFGENSWYWVKG
jgi:predicted O-methyltransferase YrrM